jgi:serine/threonine protein kinase
MKPVRRGIGHGHQTWFPMRSHQGNVLIDETGWPRLCDFGRSKIVDECGFTTAVTGTARFMAPELLGPEIPVDGEEIPDPPAPILTKESDVYGFSMVALQASIWQRRRKASATD